MLTSNISVSLVSHGHGPMVWELVDQLVGCSEVLEVIVTLNIPEIFTPELNSKVVLLVNEKPKGFGANHNSAYSIARGQFFCVINPDIELFVNPFKALVNLFEDPIVGVVAPIVLNEKNSPDDSMRRFLTPWLMAKRILHIDAGSYLLSQNHINICPDWIAGMFMLFRSSVYSKVNGFDEYYFMYCEDADICTRIWKAGYKVIGCLSVSVVHKAQRASHRSFKHLSWHIRSMARYFLSHSFSLPSKPE